jgi:hypothetical protein
MFKYLEEEREHLRGLCEGLFYMTMDPSNGDPAYWRCQAEIAADMAEPACARDCNEAADALECGMYGEVL